LNILLIDSSQKWLDEASLYFKKSGFDPYTSETGKNAQRLIAKNDYFSIVLNLNVKNHTGFEILKFIRTKQRKAIIVILAESQEFLDKNDINQQKLSKMGVKKLMVRPFTLDELLTKIEGKVSLRHMSLNKPQRDTISAEEEVNQDDNKFAKINIDEFISPSAVLFDVYVRLGTGKYIKILHEGDAFSKKRIENYRDKKNVEYLYYLSRDRKKLLRFSNELNKKLVENKKIDVEVKLTMTNSAANKFLEEVNLEGINAHVLEEGKEICENISTLIKKEKSLQKLFKKLERVDPESFGHAYLSTIFATSILREFHWNSNATIEMVAMSCMLQDISKANFPISLIEKQESDFSQDELKLYNTHPILSANMLESFQSIPTPVQEIIVQHHESGNGKGFPYGLTDIRLSTPSKIVFFANEFSLLLKENSFNTEVALKKIININKDEHRRYNGNVFDKFMNIFNSSTKM